MLLLRIREGKGGEPLGPSSSVFHPPLQDQHRRHSIHRLTSFFDGKLRFTEQPIGFGGSEALIPQMNWDFEVFTKIICK